MKKNKRLQEENEKLKKQAAIDASYMVTVEDLMARLKSHEEIIEALRQENNKLLINNAVLESDNDFLRHEIDEYKDIINVLKDEKGNLQKENEELEKKVKELKNELEKARDHIKTQKSNIALLEDKNKKLENGLEIAKRKLELQLLSNTPISLDQNKKLLEENKKLRKENEELKEALNIYQDNTEFEVMMFTDVAFLRLHDSDAAGRTVVKGKDTDTLCDAWLKYYSNSERRNKHAQNK